jgi:arylsulfatase A-like enzyme
MPEHETGSAADQIGPYAGFGGRVGRTFAGSQGWWPPRPSPPAGAPNIVVMMVDDLGYSDIGCYGSEIETPNLDAFARRGLQHTNFHSTPMCSPTRAALLTGLNAHAAGVGSVPHSDSGFPGYAMELAENAATIAETLRDNGWSTMAVGKWHLTKDAEQNAAGNKRSWPCQRGFERYYGVLDAFTNLHHPHRLVEDNHQVHIDQYPDGYFFTDDITDRAISMIRETKASDPSKPFFLYFAHAAVHAPLHAKADDIQKYRGRYEQGWDVVRERRFARQQTLGVVEPNVQLAPRNSEPNNDVRAWDELSADEQTLFARHMEVFAGSVDNIDQNFGRLMSALEELDELDNTIVIFMSDNGASREGEEVGTTAYYVHLLQGDDVEADLARIDDIGGPTTTPHYPRGWAMVGCAPFRLYKLNTHAGGHSVPFLFSWPGHTEQVDALRRNYVHVTDILPTLLDLVGVELPTHRHGQPLKPLVGASFAPMLTDPNAPSAHVEQHYENLGHRGYYRDGWEVVTLHQPLTPFSDQEWELYHLPTDPTELHDLALEEPERLRELADLWEQAAWANQVYPLDEGSSIKYLVRPPWAAAFGEPVTIVPGTPTLERWRSVQLIWFRALQITANIDFAPGDHGYLFAHGDQGAGYGFYIRDDELVFVHNDGRGRMRRESGGAVPMATRTITADFAAPGKNVWDVRLLIDGNERATIEGVPMLYGMAPFEGIDVGIDRRSPVDWAIYDQFGPFPYTGTLHSVRVVPGEPAPDSPQSMIDLIREMGARFE